MKKNTLNLTLPLLVLLLIVVFVLPLETNAQNTDKTLVRIETPKFSKVHFDKNYLYIPMNFNQAEATKKIKSININEVISISLIYSQYRASARFDQLALNDSRTAELFKLIPGLKNNKNINWYWVAQTGCTSPEACSDYFHGFEIRVASADEVKTREFESDQLEYYTNIHLNKAKLEEHIESISHIHKTELIRICDTTYTEYRDIKNRTGRFKSKNHKSRKNFLKLVNKKLNKDLLEINMYLSDRNRLESIDGMSKPEAYKLFIQMRKDFYITSSRINRKKYKTHFVISLNRNRRGKVKSYSIYAEPIDKNKQRIEMPEYRIDYRRNIRCYDLDTTTTYPNPTYVQYDDVVTQVLDRNTQWRHCLVATDVTGSMYAYLGQFLAWHKLNLNREGQNFDFIFFNDGNNMRDALKIPGRVGGTFYVHSENYKDIKKACQKAQRSGGGGDGPENNIEAVIKGINRNPSVREVIMIADNWATPRDLSLLRRVKKPIHIILCGATNGVNQEYLNMALENGGTVHTIEDDLTELAKVNEGESIRIGNFNYTIKGGKFVKENISKYTKVD
ncbi:MAG: hypothetical protein COA58_09835 [Bacteroidetes bacterium]|nr:MAG: hypothetical protein COA58_09835 [Bacteroidota bacterium]